MADATLQQQLARQCKALDDMDISPPIEITVGEYSFYPYRGFSDILKRDDFRKLSQKQLRVLIKITDDILSMRKHELFEAFVNDDGVIVIDKHQPHVEYSIDIEYNDAHTKVEELYPQVSYPQSFTLRRGEHIFVQNDTAHEVTHHADFWTDPTARKPHLDYLHSSSTLLAWLEELDLLLRPGGVASLIGEVRSAEGYVVEELLREGYTPRKIDQMLRAEFFAIAGEFYYGSQQLFSGESPLLEAYMTHMLGLDLDIRRLYIPFKDMEQQRGLLRKAIHAPIGHFLADGKETFLSLREGFEELKTARARQARRKKIEALVVGRIERLVEDIRKSAKVPV